MRLIKRMSQFHEFLNSTRLRFIKPQSQGFFPGMLAFVLYLFNESRIGPA